MKRTRFVIFLLAGLATGAAIPIAALRYYVSITQPYLIMVASFIALQLIMTAAHMMLSKGKPPSISLVALGFEAAVFAAGAQAAIYGLLAIYPPNFQ